MAFSPFKNISFGIESAIPFVSCKIETRKALWSPAETTEEGTSIGGLGLFVGEKFADKMDAGVDSENAFLWVVVRWE